MPSRQLTTALAVVLALAPAACSKSSSDPSGEAAGTAAAPPPTAPAVADPAAKAKELFAQRCVPCHGAEGKGDGVASKGLTPPPRNFSDPSWQASVTDEHIQTIIHFGGAAVGKSPAMPANPDLADPAVLAALRAHVRSLGGR